MNSERVLVAFLLAPAGEKILASHFPPTFVWIVGAGKLYGGQLRGTPLFLYTYERRIINMQQVQQSSGEFLRAPAERQPEGIIIQRNIVSTSYQTLLP